MTHKTTRRNAGPIVLGGEGLVCRVRPWPNQPDTAHLVMYQQIRPPTVAELQRWSTELAEMGFLRVRTSALGMDAGLRVRAVGFNQIQELFLLQHDAPRRVPTSGRPTGRLVLDQHRLAADVDAAAFGAEWSLDADAIVEVRNATPRSRARTAGDSPLQAYAITGRDGRQGFLQRLAVDPSHHREGLGLALVRDSLNWLGRWRVAQVLVNTPTDNQPALALYEQVGFRRLPERLRVYERELA